MSSLKVFERDNISLYCGDFLEFNEIPDGSVDLIMTSPPYNVGMPYDVWDDNMPYHEYLDFVRKVLEKCYKLVRHDCGRIAFNIPLQTFGTNPIPIYIDYVRIGMEVGFKYMTTIIWDKQHVKARNILGSWLSASAPMITTPVEAILVMFRGQWKKTYKGVSDIEKEEFLEWVLGSWVIPPYKTISSDHPATFPIEIPYRCIKLLTYVGDLVLDPFVGTGTTLVACHRLKRKGIGVDISRSYCEFARQWLDAETGQLTLKEDDE